MKKYISLNRNKFLNILEALEGFDLIIRKRVYIRPRIFDGIDIAKIALGSNIAETDVEYIIGKLRQYRLFESQCEKWWEQKGHHRQSIRGYAKLFEDFMNDWYLGI